MPVTPLTDSTKVNTAVTGAQFAPAVCALEGGGYVVVWGDFDSGHIAGQRYDSAGQPVGGQIDIADQQGGSPVYLTVAARAGGGFVVAFQAGGFDFAEIFGQNFDAAGAKSGALFAVNATTPNEQLNPHAVALSNGATLFTWDTIAANNFQEVRGRIFDAAGQPVGPDFQINTTTADAQGFSAIAPLPGGGFVVTWQSVTPAGGTNVEIIGQRFAGNGAKLGGEFQVNTQTANNQTGNDVAVLTDGSFVVTWVDPVPNDGGGRIVARHYDPSGIALGDEITIASKASGDYAGTAVTALAGGAWVVSWADDNSGTHTISAREMGANDVPADSAFIVTSNANFANVLYSDGAATLANGSVVFTWDGPSTNTGEDVYMRLYDIAAGSTPSGTPTEGPDTLDGTGGDDMLSGLGGDDVLNGLGGSDTLIGGAGADVLIGGMGNDYYRVEDQSDEVIEATGEGTDTVYAVSSYALSGGTEVEFLAALDRASTSALHLRGNEFDNVLIGNAGTNELIGNGGADVLVGLGGNDYYRVEDQSDRVIEAVGEGTDTVYAVTSYALYAGTEVERLVALDPASTAALNLTGNEFANMLSGNAGVNVLIGEGGADVLIGLGGNDYYRVEDQSDLVIEEAGEGTDTVYAVTSYALPPLSEVENLIALDLASTSALNLTGNTFDNALRGNAGANILDGHFGADTLIGGAGADTFAFTSVPHPYNIDVIADFVHGTDKIALEAGIFSQLGGPGMLNPNAFVTGSQAADGSDRIIYNSATGELFYDADGTGATAAILFATLQGAPTLSASDFQVI